MLFNSIHFLLFFPIVTLIYFIIPRKFRYIWLLLASYYFYMSLNPFYAISLLASTTVTFAGALLIAKTENIKTKKIILICSLVLNIGALAAFKYFGFIFENITALFSLVGISLAEPSFSLMLPVGISFYTFQAIGYNIDVIRGDREAEKNFFKYALFVSFFPLILSGPIERSKNLLNQIDEGSKYSYDDMRKGLVRMLWGLIQKMIIADRLAVIANTVFNNYTQYEGFAVLLGVCFYSLQIYMDFAGYSNIAIGASLVLGFKINENFNAPYFATSVAEFWRRWHMSLSSWLRDYIYVPLGGNRAGKVRKYLNIMIVFLISGLWHGADWTFVIWGALHGIYQIIGELSMPLRDKLVSALNIDRESFSHRLLKGIFTFMLISFAWIFFRAPDTQSAFGIIKNMFSSFNPWVFTDKTVLSLGLAEADYRLMMFFVGINILISAMNRKFSVMDKLMSQGLWFRWLIYISMVLIILIFSLYGGSYETASFLYFQF